MIKNISVVGVFLSIHAIIRRILNILNIIQLKLIITLRSIIGNQVFL